MSKIAGLSLFTLLLLAMLMECYTKSHSMEVCGAKDKMQRINLIREVICKNVNSEGLSSGYTGLHTPKSIRLFVNRCCDNIEGCNIERLRELAFSICEAY